ncbi:MAG: protein kinase [Myxococcota bacterium]|nr:protein kinase [Myxococcota bacterium]
MAVTAPRADQAPGVSLAGRKLGRYEVLTQLASGGMAAVYVARAQGIAGFERLVAIKVLHPHLAHEQEFISMFLDEARLAARIRHPNVVPTLDISDTEGAGYFIVMEYVEGDHLGALLRELAVRDERLPVPVAVRIVLDALAGLGAAHALCDENGQPLNLVHRDVSPHNVIVGVDGVARLVDFGVAKAEVRLSSTREGQFKGKLSYMAPEHASTGFADQRSDLFSAGVVLWEALTGRRLFRAENNAHTLNKILKEPIPLPSSVDPALHPFDPVLARALARPPEARFQSAEAFGEALEQVARAHGGVATARQVGEAVRTIASGKLAEEARRIRAAIEALGQSSLSLGETPMPVPREGSSSAVGRQQPRRVEPEAETLAAAPAAIDAVRLRARRRRLALLSIGTFVVVLVALGGWLAGRERGDGHPESMRPSASEPPGPSTSAPSRPSLPTSASRPPVLATEGAVSPMTPGAAPGTRSTVAESATPAPTTPPTGTPSRAEGSRDAASTPARSPGPRAAGKTRRPARESRPETSDEDDLLVNPYRR